MNRGFNSNYGLAQGARPNFGQNAPQQNVVDYRERANQSDRRYDDFYGASSGGGGVNNTRGGGGLNNNRGGGNWNGPPQQMGFNNQAAPAHSVGASALNVNGQVLSAIQQQSLINALVNNQQQANMGPQNQFHNMGQQKRLMQQVNNQFRRVGGGGSAHAMNNRGGFSGGVRSGDKRNLAQSGSFNRPKFQGKKFQQTGPTNKKFKEPTPRDSPKSKNKEEKTKEPAPKPVVEVEVEIDIPDDDVVVPDSLKESVETLRERTGEIERNAVDEDVDKLRVFSFTGKGYHCVTCDILLTKETSFTNHLSNKNHVMKVIDARTSKNYKETRDILEIDITSDDWFEKSELAHNIILKQAKADMKSQKAKEAKDLAEFNKTPSNFYKFNMELRKSVIQKDDEVVITSLVESTVGVKDFSGGKFFGCEFVRAVTGFHCRLCSINIREAKGVLPHIETKLHKNNYAAYLAKNPDYEKMQLVQNEDLHDIMAQHDGKSVVLAESRNAETSPFLSLLDAEVVRIPSVMDPELKKKEAEAKAKAEAEAEAEENKDEEEKGEGSKDDAEESNEAGDEDTEEPVDEDTEEPVDEDTEESVEDTEDNTEEPVEEKVDEQEESIEEETAAKEEENEDKVPEDPYAQIDIPKTTPKSAKAAPKSVPKSAPKSATVNKSKVKKLVAKVKGK